MDKVSSVTTDEDVARMIKIADALLSEPEEKHLAGQHDQKAHGVVLRGVQVSFTDEQGGLVQTFTFDRTDEEHYWTDLGFTHRPTNRELAEAFHYGQGLGQDDTLIRVRGISGDNIITNITLEATNNALGLHILRVFDKSSGELTVEHASFDIKETQQAKGIGAQILQTSEKLYRSLGVKKITLFADSEVGRYAWARMGFDFASPNTKEYMLGLFAGYVTEHGNADDYDRADKCTHTWDIAAFKFSDPSIEFSGKDFLLHVCNSYNAIKYLSDDNEGYQVGQAYYALRRKQG